VRTAHPNVIFLSEAFTRPKVMCTLAKLGFSQSYTYFTWRNTKRELTVYLSELTAPPVSEFFRPHFFGNTPYINPPFLRTSGRARFLIRAALAATLSGLWGIYSRFELHEAEALPGCEEYLNSEKYEIKHRNWNAPGNIIGEISQLNRLRRAEVGPAKPLGAQLLQCLQRAYSLLRKGRVRSARLDSRRGQSRSAQRAGSRFRNSAMEVGPPRPRLARSRGPVSRIISPGGVRYSTFA
jgi:starch synthase (maltosyl-transferring)